VRIITARGIETVLPIVLIREPSIILLKVKPYTASLRLLKKAVSKTIASYYRLFS